MKKVAFFVGDITREYQCSLITSLAKNAKENDIKLFIFACHGTYGADIFNAEGEKCLIQIPSFDKFDGIILLTDTFGVEGMERDLREKITATATCPVVSVRSLEKNFYSVLYDDVAATESQVEHLVEHHHFTKIAYMSGTISVTEAKKRLKGYLNAMNKYGLEIGEHRVFYGNYWRNKGVEAVDWFLQKEDDWPEAIICANDYMAISVCDALKERGIRIPEDICVVGYDNLEESRCYFPPLSSMSVDGENAGEKAIEILLKLWDGEQVEKESYINVKQVVRASCGCKNLLDLTSLQDMFEQKELYRRVSEQVTYMFIDFGNTHTFQEMMARAQSSIITSEYDTIYVVLNDEKEKATEKDDILHKFSSNMILKAVIKPDYLEIKNQSFKREDLLPTEYEDNLDPIIISTLHEKNECLGYTVFKTHKFNLLEGLYRNWLICMSNSLCRLKMYEDNQMLEEMRALYYKDPLTGIMNRRGYEKKLEVRFENLMKHDKGFCYFSLDMDGLKYINDTFGHAVGDEALTAFAKILASAVRGKGECARIGGDEFTACLSIEESDKAEEFCENLRAQIDKWNHTHDKQFVLSASIGYAFCNKRQKLGTCIEMADKNMYMDKARRKKNRTN